MQISPYGLLLLTQPLHSSEQHVRANLEFSSNFGNMESAPTYQGLSRPSKKVYNKKNLEEI